MKKFFNLNNYKTKLIPSLFVQNLIKKKLSTISENPNKLNFSLNQKFNFDINFKLENFSYTKDSKIKNPKFSEKILEHFYNLDLNTNISPTSRFLELLSSDLNSINSFNEKIILNIIIENLVIRPEQMKNELSYLSENPSKFIEILFNSEYLDTIMNEGKNPKLKNDLELNQNFISFVYILRYIKLLFFNFPILIKDTKLNKILNIYLDILSKKNISSKILGGNSKSYSFSNHQNILMILNIGYEISLIIDKFIAESLKHKNLLLGNIEDPQHSKSTKKKSEIPQKNSSNKIKELAEFCLINLFNKETINLCSNLVNLDTSSNEELVSNSTNNLNNGQHKKNYVQEKTKIKETHNIFLENLDEIYFNEDDNDSLVNFTKLIYIFTKIQSSTNNKIEISNLMYPVNLEKLTKFANESTFSKSKISTEANIILCNQLKKLNFINDKFFVRRIKYDGFDLDKFHILFNTFLKGDFEKEVDLINLQKNIFSISNSTYFDDKIDIDKFLLTRNTIDWVIKSIGSSICYHNQSANVYIKQVSFIRNIIKSLNNSLNRIDDPNNLFLISYFFSNFSANPKNAYEIIHKKLFDIEEVNPEILKNFVDSVDHRLKYFIQYDHEIHILKKMKKNNFEPYDKYLDNIIINISKQFLIKLSQNKIISESLFEIGLKSLKILFELEIIDPNYKIDEFVVTNLHVFKKKCFMKGAQYLTFIHGDNAEIVNTLTKILSYIKYYDNKFIDEINRKKNDLIYEEFISNLLVKEKNSIENLVILYNNLSEYLIIEDSYKNIK